jgi:hypothetical protein
VKTTIDLPEEVLRRVKAEAALRGRTLRELVLEGINRVLDHPGPPESARKKRARRFADGCGIVNSGVRDLSSNPKHMKDFGRSCNRGRGASVTGSARLRQDESQ